MAQKLGQPVTLIATGYMPLAASPKAPFKTVPEIIECPAMK